MKCIQYSTYIILQSFSTHNSAARHVASKYKIQYIAPSVIYEVYLHQYIHTSVLVWTLQYVYVQHAIPDGYATGVCLRSIP